MRAKKRFGQNFLQDSAVLYKIIQSMPENKNTIVEIGPGLGDLTQELLKIKDVVAFEIDKDLCRHLEDKFAKEIQEGRFKLICSDVLEHWKQYLVKQRYDLVANLPYYIATNIVLRALSDQNCENVLVMLQKEVADKFTAKPGAKEFSALSVLAQSVGEVRRVCVVKPNSFNPPPKVDSAVVLIQKKQNLDDKKFKEFLHIAFKQPRKTLLKNLSSVYDKAYLQHLFDELGIAPSMRPHQLATSIYHRLYAMLKEKIDARKPTANQ